MELDEILHRLSATIPHVDETTDIQNQSRGKSPKRYLPSFYTLHERQQVEAMLTAWADLFPSDHLSFKVEVPYPNPENIIKGRRPKCDACITIGNTDSATGNTLHEWALELKKLSAVGDNGKKNDFFVGKAVSPYLHERSSILDGKRLSDFTGRGKLAKRAAVIMYAFEFGDDVLEYAEHICENLEDYGRGDYENPRSVELKKTISKFKDGELKLDNIIPLFERVCKDYFEVIGSSEVQEFGPLSRHPCGLRGKLIGWEIHCDSC